MLMSDKIAPVTKNGKTIGWMFFCPGCNNGHAIQTASENGLYPGGDVWTFNGNMEKPTIRASVLVRSNQWVPPVNEHNAEKWKAQPWEQHEIKTVCHSFVTDGRIEFLGDCTHDLKGQTVDLPEP